jgi:hypothetical protein
MTMATKSKGGQRTTYISVADANGVYRTIVVTVEETARGYAWLDWSGYAWLGDGRGNWTSERRRAEGYAHEGHEVAR